MWYTGVVLDVSDSTVMNGANILVRDAAYGVIADIEGQFTLMVDPKATLIGSSVGYINKEVPVNGKTTQVIYLTPKKEILEF